MLPRKFHTAKVFLKDQAEGTGGVTVEGQLTPSTPSSAFDGFGVELKRPHLWLGDSETADSFQEGGRLTMDGRSFSISAKSVYSGIGAADHVEVLLDEIPKGPSA